MDISFTLLVAPLLGTGLSSAPVRLFPLYQVDKSCVCIKTSKDTPTLNATEITSGDSVFQVFHSRKDQREMFRVKIGSGSDTWWNYGIADEADLNGDGIPDDSWYGGDDTGFAMYLFLSSSHGYDQIDVLRTVQAGWQRRFHKSPPDLGDAGGGYCLTHLKVERSPAGLALLATVSEVSNGATTGQSYRFRITASGFRK